MFSYYWDRLVIALILSCIYDGIAVLLIIVPPIYRFAVRWRKQAKKRRKKQKKQQSQQRRALDHQEQQKK